MTGSYFKLSVLLILTILSAGQPISASGQRGDQDEEQQLTAQQKGMQENLEDALPTEDLKKQQDLANPRIIVPENLHEMSEVRVVESFRAAGQKIEAMIQDDQGSDDESSVGVIIADEGDKIMDLSRKPLAYIQKHVPFFTKRNIIFFGRLELDYSHYSNGVLEGESGFHLRRFRFGLAGQVRRLHGWNYKVEFDLSDSENTLADAYLSRHWENWGAIRIGNQKIPQTLSGATSSLSSPFMERPLPVLAFTLNHRLGVGYHLHKWKVGTDLTVFGIDPNEDVGSGGYSARGYFNPTRGRFHVIHIGASWVQVTSDSDARLWARPESNKTDIRLVDTGLWPQVDTSSAIGLELAGARGPVTLRSEFYRAKWKRSDSSEPSFKGWYIDASWFPTGEIAHYREGKFIRPTILNDRGAWELAARFSSIDLNDQDISGGEEKNLTIGVNWYSRTHWRFMGNLIKVNADGPEGNDDPWIVQFRAQYYF